MIFREVYPDFLPNPIPFLRDRILEKLERKDMFRRRQQIDIPEFYVGSYLFEKGYLSSFVQYAFILL